MQSNAEPNACNACASSKRKCGRETPSCGRCADRGWTCIYSRSRTRAAAPSQALLPDSLKGPVPHVEEELFGEATDTSITANLCIPDDLMLDLAIEPIELDFSVSPSLIQTPTALAIGTDWFLAPDTWSITHRVDTSIDVGASIATMKNYVAVLHTWVERWATTGGNPFIHPCLYGANFPACVQVAYATLATYIHRTPANTDTVLRIIEDRSNDLLQDNNVVPDRFDSDEWIDPGNEDIDIFLQLARLHALMIYQIIGLFDGDIRSRHVAQTHMSAQVNWANKLLNSAAKTLSNSDEVIQPLFSYLTRPCTSLQQRWYLWILSESIRRTWLVAVSIFPVFTALQRGWSTCPGGIMYTNRKGIWDASNATEWEKKCSGANVAFLQRFECTRLFDETEPAEIDEFGTAMLDMTFNRDLLEQWKNRSCI